MNTRNKIILPVAIAVAGIFTIIAGRASQVSADAVAGVNNSSLYVLITAAGFLLISVAAIVALFMIASGEEKK